MKEIDLIRSKLSAYDALDEASLLALYEVERQISLLHKLGESLWNPEMHIVYMHTTPDGKRYIGITKNLPNERWNEGSGYQNQRRFYKAIQAFGWNNIVHHIVAAGLTEIEAKTIETKLINEYRTKDPNYGYNEKNSIDIDDKPVGEKQTRLKQKELQAQKECDICHQLIEKFSIKTIDDTIFYQKGSEYIKESDDPVIEKELFSEHQVVDKRIRKRIIENIRLISEAKREDVFPKEFLETAQNQEIRELKDAFALSGYKQVTELDIADLITWLNETNKQYICIAMIWDQVFHLPGTCPLIVSKRMGKIIRNNGWDSSSVRRFSENYGKQQSFHRKTQ